VASLYGIGKAKKADGTLPLSYVGDINASMKGVELHATSFICAAY
jgi:hypothetical protein